MKTYPALTGLSAPISSISLSLLMLLTGCGDPSNGAPQNSTIKFNPTGMAWKNVAPAAGCYFSEPSLVQILLENENGVPLNGAELTIGVDGDFSRLYNDANNNLILDPGELTPVGPTFTTKTETFGAKSVYVEVLLGGTACTGGTTGLAYETTLSVFSGSNYGQYKTTVTSD